MQCDTALLQVGADEDVYTEIRNFQKCLIRMFDALDQEVVFFETVGSLHQSRHTLVECVPMARRDAGQCAARDCLAHHQPGGLTQRSQR